MKKILKTMIILILISAPLAYGYYWVTNRLKMSAAAEQKRIQAQATRQSQSAKDEDLIKQEAEAKAKSNSYSQCLNKAYQEYKNKYNEACGQYIIDGQCSVSDEKRYAIDGIYLHEKDLCQKLLK